MYYVYVLFYALIAEGEGGNKMKTIHIVIPYIIGGIHKTDDELNGQSYIKKDTKHTNFKTQHTTVKWYTY